MAQPTSLKARDLEVLTAVIRNYIATGEPVGSRTVSEGRKDHLSPASIRNIMAHLEAEGYLTHPHTSAGRVPTDKAFRSYAENLRTPRLQPSEAERVQANLEEAGNVEERMGRSCHLLAELTRQVGIVVSTPLSQALLEHVQLARLAEGRILVVLVARGDVVQHRMIRLGIEIPTEELERIANYLNHNFAGWTLGAARVEILRRIEEERAAYDAILRRLRLLCLAGFLRPDSAARVYMQGTANLVETASTSDPDRVKLLLQALEEKEKLIQLLDECIRDAESEPLCVRIGLEDADPAMRGYSLIGTACAVEPGVGGRIAVIGPTRMHYERVMSAVAHVARVFHSLAGAPQ